MTDQNTVPPPPIPPEAQILQHMMNAFITQAIYAAAKVGIADLLGDGAATTGDLASKSGADERSIYRLLRTLSSVGVFTETATRTFANTPMSETLRSDSPTSTRAMALFMGDEAHWRVIGDLAYSVQTGKPAWEHVHDVPCFPYIFEKNPALGNIFNQAMTSISHSQNPAVLAVYDFSAVGTLADIAGGRGHLLASVLQKYPSMKGVLFDMGVVLAGAPELLSSYGVEDRVEMIVGDFFGKIPVVADAYVLKHIIHDWYDDGCEKILGNIRRSMPVHARVLIVDSVIPPGNDPHPGKILDLEMLIAPGGIERTADEFETLLKNSGFRLDRIVPTASPVSIVEASKA